MPHAIAKHTIQYVLPGSKETITVLGGRPHEFPADILADLKKKDAVFSNALEARAYAKLLEGAASAQVDHDEEPKAPAPEVIAAKADAPARRRNRDIV